MVFGLDGCTFKKLSPWVKNGNLPFLRKFWKQGVRAELECILPTLSPTEWACFSTGKNPAKLGVFGLSPAENLRKGSEMKILNSNYIKEPTIWDILSKAGEKVGVVNIPSTYPPKPVNGFMITGMLTPPSSKKYYYPREIENHLNDYKIDLTFNGERSTLPDKEIDRHAVLEELFDIHEKRVNTIRTLLQEFEPGFFIVNFKGTDYLQHLFWEEEEILLDFYETVDENMEELWSEFGPSNTIVMSDHGFHKAEEEYLFVNKLLENKGYLKKSFTGTILTSLYPILLPILKSRLREHIPEEFKSEKGVSDVSDLMIDTSKTKARASMWGIFITKKIRNDPSVDNKKLVEEIKRTLQKTKHPESGETIFKDVYRKEEIYDGPFLSEFPELVFTVNPRFLPNPSLARRISEPRLDKLYLQGAHKSDRMGVFLGMGESFKKGKEKDKVSLLDLAPTILYLHDIKGYSQMDGSVLTDFLV